MAANVRTGDMPGRTGNFRKGRNLALATLNVRSTHKPAVALQRRWMTHMGRKRKVCLTSSNYRFGSLFELQT